MTVSRNISSKKIYDRSLIRFLPWVRQQETATDSSTKLSVVTQFFPPDYAATGQLIEELVKHLGRQGMSIDVFTGQPGYAYQSDAAAKEEILESGVRVRRSNITKFGSKRLRGALLGGLLFSFRAIAHIVANYRKYNLLLVTTAPPFLPVIGYLLNFFFNVPYICLVYDIHPDISVELGMIRRDHPIVKIWTWLNKQVWRNSKEIIVLSSNMKDRIVAHCPEVENKIAVIHSWADPQKIYPIEKKENWFAQKHNLVEKFTVLYSGNMGRCHDIDTMFKAALALKDEPIQFVCIGKGAKQDTLKAKIKQHGLTNFVFLPYQDKKDLTYSLTASDLALVSVSEGMEGLVAPSKVYGYLASGRPIAAICPESTYLNKMLEEGNCGAGFRNGDAQGLAQYILELSQDQEKAKALGESARNYLENNFSPAAIANQYNAVLQKKEAVDFESFGSDFIKKTSFYL
ncbi:glycosyltransferase family 4 protein [[Limnothrix rosea] IAM M-220]|uniref:glycosyltransferase family 4 protein n=1 Tax=[Limnothrix rosea] IAM M-220 TaxID=454133 RepID=UPI00095C3240|nr:glycosyltransferase family 4 protein [[Limnothrix rosea] IAM M-220]OKH10830.1 glycosyltransferase WbuB [[Limnothrix rosea] IAM M-220]